MIPPKKQFEQVVCDEWINGEITDVKYEENHEFNWKGVKNLGMAAKIVIRLEGYKDPKPTGWLAFNYSEKSNLYKMFIKSLVPGAHPNMQYDLDGLLRMKVKVMYVQNGEYQNILSIRPAKASVALTEPIDDTNEEVPF